MPTDNEEPSHGGDMPREAKASSTEAVTAAATTSRHPCAAICAGPKAEQTSQTRASSEAASGGGVGAQRTATLAARGRRPPARRQF